MRAVYVRVAASSCTRRTAASTSLAICWWRSREAPGSRPNRIGSPVGQQDVPENRSVKNLAGRRGVPMDIAKAAVFLACDESDFIYAVDLPVGGGALAIRD